MPCGAAGEPPYAMLTLKTRADFVRLAGGRKASTPGLVLQMRPTPAAVEIGRALRVGYTASRRVGGAVVRNRAKRRLRAAARLVLARQGKPGHDYVLVGRAETVGRPFALLAADLAQAIETVHKARQPRGASPG